MPLATEDKTLTALAPALRLVLRSSSPDGAKEEAPPKRREGGDQGFLKPLIIVGSPSRKDIYKGMDVHRTKASHVVATISKDAPFDPEDPELEYSYLFPKLELSVWRPAVPENETDAEGKFFATVGVGRKGYYSEESSPL